MRRGLILVTLLFVAAAALAARGAGLQARAPDAAPMQFVEAASALSRVPCRNEKSAAYGAHVRCGYDCSVSSGPDLLPPGEAARLRYPRASERLTGVSDAPEFRPPIVFA